MPKGKPRAKTAKSVDPIITEGSGIQLPDPVNEPIANERPSLTKEEYRAISDAAEGWLSEAEANLLVETAYKVHEPGCLWAEVGSYAGKSTVLLGGVLFASAGGLLFAIDPHDGNVSEFTHPNGGKLDTNRTHNLGPTLDKFKATVYKQAHLEDYVQLVQDFCANFVPNFPLSLVFIDGLHDYEHVLADYTHLKQYLANDATVIFHDYAWAGPYQVVNDAVAKGELQIVDQAEMLVVLKFLGVK